MNLGQDSDCLTRLSDCSFKVMCRSNRNFNIPSPRANPGHLTIFSARGVGNLTIASVGWGKLSRKCQVSNDFFFGAPKSLTAIKHVFGRDGRVQRNRCSICERLVYKKGLQKFFIKDGRSRRQLVFSRV